MIKRLLIFFLYISVSITGYSQVHKFTKDANTFVEQIEERFAASSDKKMAKEFAEYLLTFWNNPETTPEVKTLIIETCNLMAIKRARPYPDYQTYLQTVISFYTSNQREKNFNTWHNAIVDMIKKRRFPLRKVVSQLKLTKGLIEKNEIFSTPSVRWVSGTDNYTYQYSDKKLSIKFGKSDIVCHSKKDSITIFDTKGVFYPSKESWQGESGRITWERSDFPADKVYATFKDYKLDLKKVYFEIDSVDFYNRFYFDYPLKGTLRHKVMVIHDPSSSIYPKFQSSEQRYKISQIHPNINYEGGFSQNGAKFLGSGTNQNPASITIYRNDTLFITAKSLFFALRKDQILSNDTEISIKLDSGFIYHTGLIFKYMVNTNEMLFIRNNEGLSQSPYFDTYHKISMDVELIRWKLDETWMDFKMVTGAAENVAFFESLSYFREEFYNRLQGMDAMHPLQGLKNCSKYFGGKPFTATEYSQFIGLPEPQIRQQIMNLSFYGFIGYNVNTDEIEIRQHLYDYLLFRLGDKDYDVIRFNSSTPGNIPNARLDLKNFDLNMNGVSSISICDHQNVVFFPKGEKILLKENRNFQFDGVINAGMLKMFGNGFKFSYEKFKIDMSNIDSLKMKAETGNLDYYGQPILHNVENTIVNLSGSLLIDETDNKSGRKRNYQYPVLTSKTQSFVHFNNKAIQNGIYDSEKFFFTLEPFEMDSINTLKKQNFNFEGTFVSNIFPTFKEKLTIRKDFSLGFKRETPPEGYMIYGDKAHYTNSIDLSNKGLTGNGTLDYITSTSVSENFTFLPNKVTGLAHEFTIAKKTEETLFPDVQGKYVSIVYLPDDEKLLAKSQEEHFTMFNRESQLNGKLQVTPYGLTGNGLLYMLRGSLSAPRMTFGDHSVLADSSSFKLVGETEEAISFSTSNLISSDVNFETREGVFTSMGEGEPVEFTDNKYISIITKFSWNMDLNKIYMGAHGSKGNLFISTHRKQDSLQFYVPIAEYDMEKKLIVAEEVKNIKVADANFLLKDGVVTIRENAVLDPMDSVVIELGDTASFTHRIYDTRVNITGRYAYTGYGSYDFVNGDNKTYKITLHNIEANKKTKTTVAEGLTGNSDLFTFNSHFAYKGKVFLNAKERYLKFDGGVQMLHKCSSKGPQAFMRFKASIKPENIQIPVNEEVENYDRERLYKSFFLKKDSAHIYSSFIEGRKNYSDIPIITGSGYLTYNEDKKSFDIASLEKTEHLDSTGNVLRFSENDCSIIGEGILNIGVDLNQVKTKASGTIIDDRNKKEIFLSAMFGIDFFFGSKETEVLYSSFVNSSAKTSRFSDKTFIDRADEWIGKKAASNINNKRLMIGEINDGLPNEIQNMFTFSNIDFKWNTKKHSYVTDGIADLAFIKNFSVNQQVNVKAEIIKKRSGNSLEMLIEADKDTWFFFSYKNGIMYTLSSIPEYNTLIRESKPNERKQKVRLGEKSFIYMISPESKKSIFIKGLKTAETEEESDNNPLNRENKKQ